MITLLTLLKQNAREDLGIHHIVVDDWNKGVDGEQNVVLISVPSVLSKNLAPPGKHILHAYTPGTEPFSLWEGMDRKSADYRRLKEERSEVKSSNADFVMQCCHNPILMHCCHWCLAVLHTLDIP